MSVQSHLETTASALVLSESEKGGISTSISRLKSKLSENFGDSEISEQLQFGSSTRGTQLPRKVDMESDIDYMVVFKNAESYKPQTFIEKLKQFAETKYPTSEIYRSYPTVVLELNHIKFELVPAYKGPWISNNYFIPGPKSGFSEWITTDPNGFNRGLIDKNQGCNYLLKPLIRLVKYWNAQNGYIYNSYELELDITNASYWNCSTLKDYFYTAIQNLHTWNLSISDSNKVARAKEIIQNAKKSEADGMPFTAELEIKKLIPEL
ncbi:SMODS domain-containing nucleotidyltransferase [Flavihumibacter fluvii]|uniref:SMODS domain-containing nucleotidyltransferase n=1 Tax=Flavihumibacter fluvii TaxID=2838157 RepID=UPI001BDE7554|nr:nucleotidyltransferase [Flavihumibacter fluvii]ULQ50968.1 hypothetical protein KJS93_12820 [Flavihumibacter fluvii]